MTEQPEDHEPPDEHEPPVMPRWIPALIGIVLVAMGVLAVYTGIQKSDDSAVMRRTVPKKSAPPSAPPGEPQAGASLLFPGQSGENVPAAIPAAPGAARVEITGGGAAGVNAASRLWARRGMVMDVEPEDALIYVNDLPIGQARQFDTADEIYDFPALGGYTVRIAAPGYREKRLVVIAREDAPSNVALISVKLDKE